VPNALLVVENASVPSDPRVWPECKTLQAAGWSVTVVCPRGSSRDTAGEEHVDGVRILRFDQPENVGGVRGYVAEYGRALRVIRSRVRSVAAEEHVDVVHAATPPDFTLLAARSLRSRGTATILDHHDLSPELFEAKFGRHWIARHGLLGAERLGFRLADVVIAPNGSFRDLAIGRGRVAAGNVFVVRNGPDPDVFRPVPADPALRAKAPFLLGYVGLMGSQDGVLEAIDTLALLAVRRTDWHAVFAGEGDVLDEARQRVASNGLAEQVTFLGYVADRNRVVEIIASCDVCLSPEPPNPLNDNSTLIKVAEYMAVGRPVVAFDLKETAATAQGAAVLASNEADWAAALDSLLDDPVRRARMGDQGRARVLGELSWRHSESALLAAYERALEQARERSGRAQSG
jgi:glycosyltransferase involved in cell wall biosynthesis